MTTSVLSNLQEMLLRCQCHCCDGCCIPTGLGLPVGPLLWEIDAPNCADLDGNSGSLDPVLASPPAPGACGWCNVCYANAAGIGGPFGGNISGVSWIEGPGICIQTPCSLSVNLFLICLEAAGPTSGEEIEECGSRLYLAASFTGGGRPDPVSGFDDEITDFCGPPAAEWRLIAPLSASCDPGGCGLMAVYSLADLGFVCDLVYSSGVCAGQPQCCQPIACSFVDATVTIATPPGLICD